MTIKPGQAWGRRVTRPDDLVIAADDADLAAMLAAIGDDLPSMAVRRGDLARTLGVDASAALEDAVTALPIDLLEIDLDGRRSPLIACAHLIIRPPWRRGAWLRGPVVIVMNAEFVGDWDVAPRGHPNDGRAEVFEVAAAMPMRQRLRAARRARTATHVPHPMITTRSVRSASWAFPRALAVFADGRHIGDARSVTVRVLPDAAVVHA